MTPMALYVDSFNDVLEGGRRLRLIISADMIKLDMMGGRQICADTFYLDGEDVDRFIEGLRAYRLIRDSKPVVSRETG